MTKQQLLEQIENDPYNEVAGHFMPSGELCLFLSHHITTDCAVIIRVRNDDDIISLHADEFDVVNDGGDWPHE